MDAELLVLEGKNKGLSVHVDSAVILGRSVACGLQLFDEEVSRQHLRIYRDPNGYILEDLGSNNGTFVNGQAANLTRLFHLDEIVCGNSRLLFRCPSCIGLHQTEIELHSDLDLSTELVAKQFQSSAFFEQLGATPQEDVERDSVNREMAILLRAVHRLSRQTSPQELFQCLLDSLKETIPHRHMVLFRYHQDTRRISPVLHRTHKEGTGKRSRIPVNRPLVELCCTDRKGIVHELPADGGVVLTAPIQGQQAVLGAAYIEIATGENVERKLDMLAAMCRQAGLVLERSELLIEAQHQKMKLQEMHQESAAATRALEGEESKLRAVLDGLDDAVILVDRGGLVILTNPLGHGCLQTVCRMSGPSRIASIADAPFEELISRLSSDESRRIVEEIECGDRHYMFSITDVPLGQHSTGEGESGFSLVFRDVTDEHKAREQLLQAEKLSSMGQMISGVAHELNNPLFGILGMSQLLQSAPGVPPEVSHDLDRINREAERCSKIVKSLLAFGRKRPPEREMVQVNELLEGVIDLLAYQIKTDDVQIHKRFEVPLSETHADGHQLQQVFLNLLHNALQAVIGDSSGEPGLVTVSTVSRDGMIEVMVEDNGPGISDKHITRLFDPFFTTKEVGAGSGLGLSLAYGIIQQHGGDITVESAEGAGATFRVNLPIAAPPERAADVDADLVATHAAIGPLSILIVDDEEAILHVLERALSQLGHACKMAGNGEEALALAAANEFDCMFCDLKMPGMNGPAVYEALRERNDPLASRIVFMTGDLVNPKSQGFIKDSGCLELAKPFRLSRLSEVLAQISRAETP